MKRPFGRDTKLDWLTDADAKSLCKKPAALKILVPVTIKRSKMKKTDADKKFAAKEKRLAKFLTTVTREGLENHYISAMLNWEVVLDQRDDALDTASKYLNEFENLRKKYVKLKKKYDAVKKSVPDEYTDPRLRSAD